MYCSKPTIHSGMRRRGEHQQRYSSDDARDRHIPLEQGVIGAVDHTELPATDLGLYRIAII